MHQVLMFPEDLPSSLRAVRAASSPTVTAVADLCDDPRRDVTTTLAALADIPLRPAHVKLDRWEWRGGGRRLEKFAVLDRFFGVRRSAAGDQEMFCHGVVTGYRTMLQDAQRYGTDLEQQHWDEMRAGVEAVIRFATGRSTADTSSWPVPAGEAPRDPHLRWRTGHQLFFPLIQAVLVALRCFLSAVLAGEQEDAAACARLAAEVMTASSRALQFAADFAPSDYGSSVRRSMTPPGTPEALSGLMSADHHQMVVAFQEIRPIVPVLGAELRPLYDGFVESVELAYAAHEYVCRRFNGDKVVSLRMSNAQSMSAAEVLAQMGRARTKLLRPS